MVIVCLFGAVCLELKKLNKASLGAAARVGAIIGHESRDDYTN